MSPAAILFAALLAIELPLALLALSSETRASAAARRLMFLLPLLLVLGLRAALALTSRGILDWDEPYYLSIAVTGAAGDGLYPYIFGYGPMRIMGGIGYAAYSYALAVKIFGPTIFALRAVSLLASLLGVAGVFVLVRKWYGSAAAWIAAPLTASLALFALANSVRMDSWTFAYVAWALVAFATAVDRWSAPRWHFAVGLLFGLGLQFHVDTVATALACGFVYLLRFIADVRESRRPWQPRHPMVLYVAGFLAGVLVYVCANVLPDPASYYATAVVVRLDASDTYSSARPGILSTFLNPSVLLAKEAVRYRQLLAMTSRLEVLVIGAGIVAMAIRRNATDRVVLPLIAGVLLGAAIVLNNGSPHYYIHVLPALIVPAAALFSHRLSGRGPVPLSQLPRAPLAITVVVVCALCATAGAKTWRRLESGAASVRGQAEAASRITERIDRRCEIAGDGGLYVPYFPDYPYFVSARDTEVRLAMRFYDVADEAGYWEIKRPEVVLALDRPLRPALRAYVERHGFTAMGPGTWVSPAGCRRAR